MSFIFQPGNPNPGRRSIGGKAAALEALRGTSVAVPQWFVLRAEAFWDSLDEAGRAAFQRAHGIEEIRSLVERLRPNGAVCNEVKEALMKLSADGAPLAVRSSAAEEDGADHSFAGQLDSFLFVALENVAEKIAAVWRSAFSERAAAYRRQRGVGGLPSPPAVLIQRMVVPEAAGVAFSSDPARAGMAVVVAVRGLGTALVGGEVDADTWQVNASGTISSLQSIPTSSDESTITTPALSDNQVREIAALARDVEGHFGRPQDIEWAFEGGRLWLLQSRPITSLPTPASSNGPLRLWDNSNIVESYSGVTTPLTFSFARRAYEEVYRQFCRMMGVPRSVIADHSDTFAQMLGLIRGRVYYNLLSWYRVLSMLPGYALNRRFMEQMMGVKESLPAELEAEIAPPAVGRRGRDALALAGSLAGLAANHFLLYRRIRAFNARLDDTLAPPQIPLEKMSAHELTAHYRGLERRLLTRWDAPLVNDFFAMIFFGVLGRLATKWCADSSLHNALLCGESGMISAEPARRIKELARLARRDASLIRMLCDGPLDKIRAALDRMPEFQARCADYLEKFGDRCLDELKLESPTLHDNPLPLFRSIGRLPPAETAAENGRPGGLERRTRAETRAVAALGGHPIRRMIFRWVLRHARDRVRDRENLRFARTRVFGRVRRVFSELGRRLHAIGRLDDASDVFYLEVGELLGVIEGTATTAGLKSLVAARKNEFEVYREGEAPPSRFQTRGLSHDACASQSRTPAPADESGLRRGLGCSPGIVRGRVRLVADPREAIVEPGEIIVAERTDPGWVLIFPLAAGLLVERGSLLSHSAIVARELGLPAIVAITGVTHWLRDGDVVEMDGSSGLVRKLEPAEPIAIPAVDIIRPEGILTF